MGRQPIDIKDDFVTKLWRIVINNLSEEVRYSDQKGIFTIISMYMIEAILKIQAIISNSRLVFVCFVRCTEANVIID